MENTEEMQLQKKDEIVYKSPEDVAKTMQQLYYECFGSDDWYSYDLENILCLKKNIGFALFGPPEEKSILSNDSTGYNEKQNKEINKIIKAIMRNHYTEENSTVLINFLFVCCIEKNEKQTLFKEPVFVVKKCHCNENKSFVLTDYCRVFIDSAARVYTSWTNFLENNKFPKCKMIFPVDGVYSGHIISESTEEVEVILSTKDSPACNIANRVLDVADITGTILSVGTGLVAGAVIIPGIVVTPVVAATASVTGGGLAVYSAGRSIYNLIDRKIHKQSLKDKKSVLCLLNASVGVVAVSTAAATNFLTKAVSKGSEINKFMKIAFNSLQAVNALGSATNCGVMIYCMYDTKNITAFEMYQLISSILFLTHSVVNFQTASAIISETQANVLNNYEKCLQTKRQRKSFRRAMRKSRNLKGENVANAEKIRSIKNINDPDSYYAGLIKLNKTENKNQLKYTIDSNDMVHLNKNYVINPQLFSNNVENNETSLLMNQVALIKDSYTTTSLQNFNVTKNTVIKYLFKFAKDNVPAIMQIIKHILENEVDIIDIIAVLLKGLTDIVIQEILNILFSILSEMNSLPLVKRFKLLFPLIPNITGVLQFLINFIKKKNETFDTEMISFLNTLFDRNGNVNKTFIKSFTSEFQNWIERQIDNCSGFIKNEFYTQKHIDRVKKKTDCKQCNGYYFAGNRSVVLNA